jgi:catechol 2,3-dioxygenase-like lactoylglutathione lyase family enzyme
MDDVNTIVKHGKSGSQLRLRGLSHTTVPVRDRYKAARFYVAVLGAEVSNEAPPDRVKLGLSRSLQIGLLMASGIELDVFEQDYGQPAWDQSHPHHAFDVPAEDVAAWVEQLTKWRVPFFGPMTRSGTTGCEIYFDDLDGNHLEINCKVYPGREKLHSGPYDKSLTTHKQPWPAPDLEAEADRLFNASLQRFRAQRKDA